MSYSILEFDDVYDWLDFKAEKGYLGDPVEQLGLQIKQHLDDVLTYETDIPDCSRVKKFLTLSVEVRESSGIISGEIDQDETQLECECACSKMQI